MSNRIITLLSDFGIQDGYVASMKGVILTISPDVRLVDISHMIPPRDIRAGAFILDSVYRDFPQGTIHVAVVDPGVGTARSPLAIKTSYCFFVGPDNGLFSLVVLHEKTVETRRIENPRFLQPQISNTFHGRDIFAPVSAYISRGIEFHEFGPLCAPYVTPWSTPLHDLAGIHGEVIHIDRFGNAITNMNRLTLATLSSPDSWVIHVKGAMTCKAVRTYGDADPGVLAALIGSSGYLEIAVNQGSAAIEYGIQTGDPVSIRYSSGQPPRIIHST